MAGKSKAGDKSGGKEKGSANGTGKGKGKGQMEAGKKDNEQGGGASEKLKAATSINVRHILVVLPFLRGSRSSPVKTLVELS